MEEQDDPFDFLIKRCIPTPSQEEILRTCPFARQSEVFPSDSDGDSPSSEPFGIPVDSTSIRMVSPPEEFQTPPEDSLPVSSEEQRPPAAAVCGLAGPTSVSGGQTMAVENLVCTDAERAVDLGKDSDNLEFSGVNSTQVVDGGNSSRGVDGVVLCEAFETEEEELVVLSRESNLVSEVASLRSVPKKLKTFGKSFGVCDLTVAPTADKEPVIMETNRVDNNAVTEVFDLEVEEIGGQLVEDNMFVDLPMREIEVDIAPSKADEVFKNGKRVRAAKNIEDLDKFKYISPSGDRKVADVGGRRELPSSIRKAAITAGEESGQGASAAKDKIFKGLLDALKMVAGQLDVGGTEEEDVDFLETAKRRGMTLPVPRWWLREDYDD